MKNLPSTISEVKDDWLRSLFVGYDGFDAQLIKDIEKEPSWTVVQALCEFNHGRKTLLFSKIASSYRWHASSSAQIQDV